LEKKLGVSIGGRVVKNSPAGLEREREKPQPEHDSDSLDPRSNLSDSEPPGEREKGVTGGKKKKRAVQGTTSYYWQTHPRTNLIVWGEQTRSQASTCARGSEPDKAKNPGRGNRAQATWRPLVKVVEKKLNLLCGWAQEEDADTTIVGG